MQTAIATAIKTVRIVGPSLALPTAVPNTKRMSSPKPTAQQAQQQPARGAAKATTTSTNNGTPTMADAPPMPSSVTFTQMAASVLNPPTAAALHPVKAHPMWCAIETNKSLVLCLGTKGTRVSELHIRIPKVAATAHLFSLSGTKLINEILQLINKSHNKDGIRALKENHLVLVKWSMCGNLIIKCSKPMDNVIKNCLHDAIKAAVLPGSNDSISILNKPPTTALKFMTVPRHNEDGTDTDSYDLHNDLMAHQLWHEVEIFSQPCFLPMKHDATGGTVIVSIVDNNQGSVGRKLMNVVSFSGASRRCLRWVEKEAQLFCTQCQCWGHLNFNCLSNIMRCSKCAGLHDYKQHDRFCDICKSGKGKLCILKCHNCHGPHFASSKDCVFYLNQLSKERQIQLCDEFSQKWKEEDAALKATANSDSGQAACVATAIKSDKKGKTKAKSGIQQQDDDDYVPIGKGGKAKYTFKGMAQALASTTRIEEVVVDNDSVHDSDSSSELWLSYVDNVPLSKRFPASKPPPRSRKPPPSPPPPTTKKPLMITFPALGSSQPLCSVTDILHELKAPAKTTLPDAKPKTSAPDTPFTRFGGGEVAYSASALQGEADAFATALATSGLPSQPSPTADSAPAVPPQSPTSLNVYYRLASPHTVCLSKCTEVMKNHARFT